MLCAGLTAYSPLVRNGAGPGKKVGIVGIGGIGHFGVLFAKALGAEVWAISRSRSKEEDSLKMGADGYIATAEENWNEKHKMSFDLIVNTASSSEGFDLSTYLTLLDVHGKWVSVGLPGGGGFEVRNQDFLPNGCFIGSSHLGSRRETLEMLDLAAEKKLFRRRRRASSSGSANTRSRARRRVAVFRFTAQTISLHGRTMDLRSVRFLC
ncbi:hypothetical protein BN1723_018452, partial [Verticillium longisporum]